MHERRRRGRARVRDHEFVAETPVETTVASFRGLEVQLLIRHGARFARPGALHRAASVPGALAMVELLLDHGAPPNRTTERRGPLFDAIRSEDPRIVLRLLEAGADPNERDEDGNTPLHRACSTYRGPAIVNPLLRAGADRDVENRKQSSPYYRAVLHNNHVIMKVLQSPAPTEPIARRARRLRLSPDEIRALGCPWPPSGWVEEAYAMADGRVDLERCHTAALHDATHHTSQATAGRWFASQASRVSFDDYENFRDQARDDEGRARAAKATLADLEAILACVRRKLAEGLAAPIAVSHAPPPMPGATRDRLFYSVGNEHNPGNPFGRQHLVIEVDGRARLDHYTIEPHFAWTGTVRAEVVDRIFRALAESDFPALPTMNMVAGATTRSLSIGHGLAARSTFVDYHKALSLPGYAVLFPLLDSLVRQLSQDEVKVVGPRDEVLVDDVRATDSEEPRDLTPGIAYLFACLPAHAIALEARKDLVERFAEGADEKLAHAIEFSRRALKLDTTRMDAAERRISAMARTRRLELARGGPAWRSIADAVRPHLGTELSRAAWSAGEAARLVLVSVALLAHTAYLRSAAPDHPGLREFAEERARALVANADLLNERLGATGHRLVMSHADSVAKMVALSRSFLLATTSGGYAQLQELEKDLDGFIDGHARRFDETPPPEASSAPTAEELSLYARILQDPSDMTLRHELMRLGEQRNDPRAKVVRLMIAGDDRARHEAYEITRAHPEWKAPLEKLGARDIEFALGFPDLVTVDAEVFLARGAELLAAAPLTRIKIRMAQGRVADVVRSPLLRTLERLDLDSQGVTDDDLALLAASPHARRLEHLDLRYNPISARGIEAIAASPHLKQLRVVALDGNPDDPVDRQVYFDETSYDYVPTDAGKALEAKYGPLQWLRQNQ